MAVLTMSTDNPAQVSKCGKYNVYCTEKKYMYINDDKLLILSSNKGGKTTYDGVSRQDTNPYVLNDW